MTKFADLPDTATPPTDKPSAARRRLLYAGVAGTAALGGAGLAWWKFQPHAVEPGAEQALWGMQFDKPEGGVVSLGAMAGNAAFAGGDAATALAQFDVATPLAEAAGDAKVAAIAAASILAKVARDIYMTELENTFPGYGFAKHKGYGTKAHYEAIATYGITPVHRKTFLKKILGE